MAKKTSDTRSTAPKKSAHGHAEALTSPKKSSMPEKSGSAGASAHSRATTDHDEIRKWAEQRSAHPACVKGTGGENDVGILRLDFPGYSEENLQEITWEEFFDKFDERGLALLYQERTAAGEVSNFNKLVSRETVEEKPKTRTAH